MGTSVVCRGSKRGWSTGATAAVDPRVIEEPYSYRDRLTTPRPRLQWTIEANGGTPVGEPRDFRLMTIGPAYQSSDVLDQGGGTCIGRVPGPEKGGTAFPADQPKPERR